MLSTDGPKLPGSVRDMSGQSTGDEDAADAAVAGAVVHSSLPEDLPLPARSSDIAQLVALRAAACVGADYSNLALIIAGSPTQLRLFHRPFLDPAMSARYLEISLAAPFPIAAAIRDQRVIVLNGEGDYLAQFPEIWEDTQAAGIEATCSLPVCRSDGSPIGALGFAWSTPPPFDLKLDQALRAVGDLVAEIIERAEVYEAEHQLIASLHARLLSALPEFDGIATAARYQAAGRSDAIGGDWFEGLVLDDGLVAVVLGDVTGHGLTAAADMALIRGLITALLHDGVHVKDVFALVSRVLTRRPEDLLATAVVALVDTGSSTLTYATAGHPPPLLIHPDRTVERLDQANAPMLGILTSDHRAEIAPFPPGATLIMYTDGLVERRNRPFAEGVDRAVDFLTRQSTDLSAGQYIDALFEALVGDRTDNDDIAVVVVKNVS
jgi:serine phosphatase RsbU (regulator of sigma subunit)